MKKIFTTLFLAGMMLSAHAALGLSFVTLDENEEEVITNVTKDTTIVVSNYEEDFFGDGGMIMSLNGYITTTSKTLKVTIDRPSSDIKDEFCLGGCYASNNATKQELNINISKETENFITHFYPTTDGVTTITYTFNDGVNPAIALTVQYSYMTSSVENTIAQQGNGIIYNLLGQQMQTTNLNELPKGIYIINGKKFIKQ